MRFSIPQCGEEHHQNDDKLEDFDLVEDAHTILILEILDALLQSISHLRQLLHSADALHENSILWKYLRNLRGTEGKQTN